jgi:hypothetical protein
MTRLQRVRDADTGVRSEWLLIRSDDVRALADLVDAVRAYKADGHLLNWGRVVMALKAVEAKVA